ncbi:hypothetical protein LPB140_05290 [Sphingorhabdus lutea]|uniref:ABC-type transport auxiliary lipoprotein component domain-containing protein n=2 Tax=Sphingorhabdus lutea TaxID=1913578 RepID=A0A1L3JB25_9SPHN|nr:hypothetical protein LPB140_05290 [Sphingorhabdus lutea]
MNKKTKYMLKSALILPVIGLLSACISLGTDPLPSMLTLKSNQMLDAGQVKSLNNENGLVIALPLLPRKLDTTRIPVQIDDQNIAYLTQTAWVDKPNNLFQSLLMEQISAGSNFVVMDEEQGFGKNIQRISIKFHEFGIDSRTNQAMIIADVTRHHPVNMPITKRFAANVPVAEIAPSQAGYSLNKAANMVAADILTWIK